ncbi:MAG: hypothetical protein CM1200mP2_31720 [Planctomycetaceae bacterium]|nr:MAG: hypothetical protein CM1200mP2_31720 [Planctomycetaceae bacterium]
MAGLVGFVVEYSDPRSRSDPGKTEMLIDCQLGVPVVVRNFSWPTTVPVLPTWTRTRLWSATLPEIKFQREVARGDFDRGTRRTGSRNGCVPGSLQFQVGDRIGGRLDVADVERPEFCVAGRASSNRIV